jgi:lipopolysaccharide transport system ATP-binding protein
MTNIILKAENVSKQYRLGLIGTGTISHDFNRWWASIRGKEDPYLKVGAVNDRSTKADSDYVWALKDINFEVQRGEVLGIIGKNGAGKSTLLKILSRVTIPTTGEIKTKGRIASLLEVGTGFHPELTGRENIYLNGAILGMTKAEIKAKEEEIIEFSGCQMYVDTPVKRYSSGMRVRLAFAVAAFLEPDILVIDEVLAVGDAEFQKKAIGKMQDISKGEGRTVLFVSHNMTTVQKLCSRLLILENGNVVFEGNTEQGILKYLRKENLSSNSYENIDFYSEGLNVKSIEIEGSDVSGNSFSYEDQIRIRMIYNLDKSLNGLVFVIRITDENDNVLFTSWNSDCIETRNLADENYSLFCALPTQFFKTGTYFITFAIHIPRKKIILLKENILNFHIDNLNYKINENRLGLISPKLEWNYL